MILYDSKNSGNGWKIRLLLSHLGLAYERRILDLAAGDAKTPEFLRLNPWGRVPVLQADDGQVLRESAAILMALATGTPLFPATSAPEIIEWLLFEQYDHLRFLARPRYLLSIAKTAAPQDDELTYLRAIGSRALAHMETKLSTAQFLAGDFSIADIALFPYTDMAEMGGYELALFPNIGKWLHRIRSRPGFVPFTHSVPAA